MKKYFQRPLINFFSIPHSPVRSEGQVRLLVEHKNARSPRSLQKHDSSNRPARRADRPLTRKSAGQSRYGLIQSHFRHCLDRLLATRSRQTPEQSHLLARESRQWSAKSRKLVQKSHIKHEESRRRAGFPPCSGDLAPCYGPNVFPVKFGARMPLTVSFQ